MERDTLPRPTLLRVRNPKRVIKKWSSPGFKGSPGFFFAALNTSSFRFFSPSRLFDPVTRDVTLLPTLSRRYTRVHDTPASFNLVSSADRSEPLVVTAFPPAIFRILPLPRRFSPSRL